MNEPATLHAPMPMPASPHDDARTPAPRVRASRVEAVATAAVALAVGIAIGWLDFPAREYQSGLLVYLFAGFWLALAGRGRGVVAAVACGLAPPMALYLAKQGAHPAAIAAAFAATLIGAVAGRWAGRRMDPGGVAAVDASAGDIAWYRRPLSARTLLALALSAIAAIGLQPLFATLRHDGIPVSVAMVRWWQAATFAGWVFIAPVVPRIGAAIRRRGRHRDDTAGVTPPEALAHLAVLAAIALVHTAVLLAIGHAMGWMGPPPPAGPTARAIAAAYAPLDLLAYAVVLGLAWLGDTRRHAEEARRRAAALQAAVLGSRLAALRARLNPHFLYNALNAAVVLARGGRGRETGTVLEELTGMLRYVLERDEASVPLADEVAFVRRYLGIQQVRFGERLRWSVEMDGEAPAARVPTLVLQPMVENAVEHAVASDEDASEVRVTARRDGGVLVLQVEDDGPGPPAEGLVGDEPAGIGLGHTRERLHGLFGAAASVTLRPRQPRGAVAEIRLPYRAEDAP